MPGPCPAPPKFQRKRRSLNDGKFKTTAKLTQRGIFETIFRVARPVVFRFRCELRLTRELRMHNMSYRELWKINIQLSFTVRIPIFWLADLYHVILGCDETTTLTSLSWCNSRGVNSTHHCHRAMASNDSNIVVSMQCFFVQCVQFE